MAANEARFIERAEDVSDAARRLDLAVRQLIALGDGERAINVLVASWVRCYRPDRAFDMAIRSMIGGVVTEESQRLGRGKLRSPGTGRINRHNRPVVKAIGKAPPAPKLKDAEPDR
jgi:hypothetical protein